MYIYESHMGGLYARSKELSFEERYCETCGDSDTLIGVADSADEAWALLKPNNFPCLSCEEADFCERECEDFGDNYYGHYGLDYVLTFISETFDAALEIVWKEKCEIKGVTPGDVAVVQFDPDKCGADEASNFFKAACKYLPYKTVAILPPKHMDLEYWTIDQLRALEMRIKEILK